MERRCALIERQRQLAAKLRVTRFVFERMDSNVDLEPIIRDIAGQRAAIQFATASRRPQLRLVTSVSSGGAL
jgi:hypothetical protein